MTTNAIHFVNAKTIRCFTVTRDNADFMAKRRGSKLSEFDFFTREVLKHPNVPVSPMLSVPGIIELWDVVGPPLTYDPPTGVSGGCEFSGERPSRRKFAERLHECVMNEIVPLMTKSVVPGKSDLVLLIDPTDPEFKWMTREDYHRKTGARLAAYNKTEGRLASEDESDSESDSGYSILGKRTHDDKDKREDEESEEEESEEEEEESEEEEEEGEEEESEEEESEEEGEAKCLGWFTGDFAFYKYAD